MNQSDMLAKVNRIFAKFGAKLTDSGFAGVGMGCGDVSCQVFLVVVRFTTVRTHTLLLYMDIGNVTVHILHLLGAVMADTTP